MITGKIQLSNNMEAIKKLNTALNQLDCDVDLRQGRYVIDGKSIMGMFSLNLLDMIEIMIHTDDEAQIAPIRSYILEYSVA